MTTPIHSQILFGFYAKSLENFWILALGPARCMHIDRLINRFDTILFFEPVSHNIELQLAHSANNNIVIAEWEEDLSAALL